MALAGIRGEWITLTGIERVPAGALSAEHSFGQTWWMSAAPVDDLSAAESRASNYAHQLQDLRASLEKGQG